MKKVAIAIGAAILVAAAFWGVKIYAGVESDTVVPVATESGVVTPDTVEPSSAESGSVLASGTMSGDGSGLADGSAGGSGPGMGGGRLADLTPEEKAEVRAKMQSLTPEERQAYMAELGL